VLGGYWLLVGTASASEGEADLGITGISQR